MRTNILISTALLLLLSLGSVLLVSVISLSHTTAESHLATGMHDCPFMAHEEALCPMSAFDHLAMLGEIFKTTLPGSITLSFAALLLVPLVLIPKPLTRLPAHTFWRWRWRVLSRFSPRPLQLLFSQGILHPKLF